MTHSSTVTVYTTRRDRGFAHAIAAGISDRADSGPHTADMSLLENHTSEHGRALVLLPLGGVDWQVKELSALEGSVLIGDLSGGHSLIRGLAAGARTALNSQLPFASLLDELQAALNPNSAQPAHDTSSLVQRIRLRAEEFARISSLTDREFEIMGLLYGGSNVDSIARTAHIAPTTVRAHIRSILQKLGVHSQLEACGMLRRSGHDTRRYPLELRIGRF
ncbi:response regulator transcription factor [Rhodococcus sp. IC4_135]|uniref:LuxR C-terminal-related transcriptional regulator n=1 Tax=Rhodococcus sp. IC4_135 TaxID=2715537 RepID=UPI00141D9D51|nr:response regulator transcription factor [Rhodococcus sp. IC4_135]